MADFVDLPSTMWTAIARARSGGREALETLVRQYRPPVVAFARNAGFPPDEAEDIAQEVFLAIVRDDVLAKADRNRGKFRSLLLAITRHAMSARRRKAARRKESPPATEPGEEALPLEDLAVAADVDDDFDRLWVQNLVRIGMNRLREESDKEGSRHFEALLMFSSEGLAYPAIGERLGLSVTDVTNLLHQARLRLKRHVLAEMRHTAISPDDYESEAAYLARFLA